MALEPTRACAAAHDAWDYELPMHAALREKASRRGAVGASVAGRVRRARTAEVQCNTRCAVSHCGSAGGRARRPVEPLSWIKGIGKNDAEQNERVRCCVQFRETSLRL
jgi:hypothetical protein